MTKTKERGQMLVLAIIVVALVMINTILILSRSLTFFQSTTYQTQAAQATALAEAAVDKALVSLNNTGGSYSGENETSLGGGVYSVSITSPSVNTKIIESTGFIPSKTSPKAKRTIKVTVSKGVGISFNYGIQVGVGGIEMGNSSIINGSVYSNGNIIMSNNSRINGDAYVAGGSSLAADQENSCFTPNCYDLIFGREVEGDTRLDIAQSFQPQATNYLSKISLNLKKVGNPSDMTVKILKDNNGKPDKNSVLASGILPSSMVVPEYNFVDITFSSTPLLTAGTTYWIVLDTSSNLNNYWIVFSDALQGYTNGQALWSDNWQASNPVWSDLNRDLDFKTFAGGIATFIQGSSGNYILGEAHANILKTLSIGSGAYYQTKENITASSYHPESPDPAEMSMPISSGNIESWKEVAENQGEFIGNITDCRSSLGPGKYIGNVSLSNNCTVSITDPIWITGSFNLSNGVTLNLNSSYGSSSGVIIIDGQVFLSNNVKIRGSGTEGSYLTTISTFDSQSNGQTAIDVSNSGNDGILYAPTGIINVSNNNRLTEISAWKIKLGNNVTVDYDSGLASSFFFFGPSGAYSLVKGTYQIK